MQPAPAMKSLPLRVAVAREHHADVVVDLAEGADVERELRAHADDRVGLAQGAAGDDARIALREHAGVPGRVPAGAVPARQQQLAVDVHRHDEELVGLQVHAQARMAGHGAAAEGVRQLLERSVLADRAPDVHGAAIDVDPAGIDGALGVARHVAAVVEVAGRVRLGDLHALVERERLAAVDGSRNAGAADVVVDRPADLAAGSAVELGFGNGETDDVDVVLIAHRVRDAGIAPQDRPVVIRRDATAVAPGGAEVVRVRPAEVGRVLLGDPRRRRVLDGVLVGAVVVRHRQARDVAESAHGERRLRLAAVDLLAGDLHRREGAARGQRSDRNDHGPESEKAIS